MNKLAINISKLFLYLSCIGSIVYLSFWLSIFTVSIMPFSPALIKLTSSTASPPLNNLLFNNLVNRRNIGPVMLGVIITRKIFPPVNIAINRIGNLINSIRCRGNDANVSANSYRTADIQLPSYSGVETEAQRWQLNDNRLHFKEPLSLNMLNFLGCTILLLLFLIYLFLVSSLFSYAIDWFQQSLRNFEKTFHKIYTIKSPENLYITQIKKDKLQNINEVNPINDFVEYK